MSEPTTVDSVRLQELLDKQEIYEVLARYCRGLDRGDGELIRSVFHPGAVHNQIGTVEPVSALVDGLQRPTRKVLKALAHMISNVLIAIDGNTATTECYFLASHRVEHRGGEWTWIVGGRYLDRLDRRDGGWRISQRTAVYEWARTDPIAQRPDDLPLVQTTNNALWGRGDSDDPSYAFVPNPS
jgi:hypothetical protein